jgi:hypothetical protein
MVNELLTKSLQEYNFGIRYLLGLSIIFFGVFVLPSSLIEYETNHNFIFNSMFAKVTHWRFHSPQMFIIYDYLLLKLYGSFGYINWYFLLNFALLWLSYTAFYFTFTLQTSVSWFLIYTSIVFLFSSVFLLHVHTAYLLCICGIFLNYKSTTMTNVRKRNLMQLFSICTYLFGFFLRWEIGALTIFLYSIVLIFNFNRKKILNSLVLIVSAYLLVVSVNLFFATSVDFEYRIEPYGEYLFLDGRYQPEQMNSLEDTIRYEMLTSWLVDDTFLLSFNDMLKELEVAQNSNRIYVNKTSFYESIKITVLNFPHLTLMIIFCCIVLILEKDVKKSILILPILGSLFIRTSVLDERHLFGIFLFLFIFTHSTSYVKLLKQKFLLLLIFLVSMEYIYEKQLVQSEIRKEKDVVISRMRELVHSGKCLYASILYPDIFPDRVTLNSRIYDFSTDSIVLLSLHQASHTKFFAEYLSKYCGKNLLNIGNVYSCVAQDENNVLIAPKRIISVLEKIVNRFYFLDIKFNQIGELYGNSDPKYNFKHFREPLYLYHLEFNQSRLKTLRR